MIRIIVGTQWGDEGKGRVCHFAMQNADVVIRCTGGNNAGHTVVSEGETYKLHLLPASIINPSVLSIIGTGVVVDPRVLVQEIRELKARGIKITPDNLVISNRAHVILPIHVELDKIQEAQRGDKKIGTTLRGIGPCYQSKSERVGIRMCDLVGKPETLKEKIHFILMMESANLMSAGHTICESEVDEIFEEYSKLGQYLAEFVKDTKPILRKEALNIVLEGAQSTFLDLDWGTYPDVTSSNPIASGACTGAGVPLNKQSEVIGVMKAYTSRVGEGAFPTEQNNEVGDRIRELGHEYGTTTNRPRRCGWLDLVMVLDACYINGCTALALNHLDTIGKFEEIQVCRAYDYKGEQVITYVPVDLEDCEPIYKTFKGGWSTEGVTSFDELDERAKKFIEFIETYTEVPVKYIGVGPDAKDTIVR